MINQQENGQKQGLWAEPTGSGQWLGYYDDGQKQGSWSYYEGQALLKLATYHQNVKQGPGYKFGPNGNLVLALEFDQDRIHGRVRFFTTDGEHIATYSYIYDKLDRVEHYVLHDESPPKNKTYLPEF
jgi:antitoxin component YwqK of YwqJK toxin-antitoxin module